MSSKHKTDDQIMIRFTFHGLAAIKTQRTAIKRLTAAVLTKTPNFAYGSGWDTLLAGPPEGKFRIWTHDFVHSLLDLHLPAGTLALGAIAHQRRLS